MPTNKQKQTYQLNKNREWVRVYFGTWFQSIMVGRAGKSIAAHSTVSRKESEAMPVLASLFLHPPFFLSGPKPMRCNFSNFGWVFSPYLILSAKTLKHTQRWDLLISCGICNPVMLIIMTKHHSPYHRMGVQVLNSVYPWNKISLLPNKLLGEKVLASASSVIDCLFPGMLSNSYI